MLTRTRNELLIAAGFGLLILGVGTFHFRMRVERARAPVASRAVSVHSDDVPGDKCPLLTSWVASPLQTSVGGWIDVGAAAVDEDRGETVRFAWYPPSDFENAHAPKTRYRCAAAGRQTLGLEVTDDHRPKSCTTRLSMAVDCVPR